MDRCVKINLQRISTQQRERLSDLRGKFKEDLPLIIGAIFDTIGKTLSLIDTIKNDTSPSFG